MRQYNDWEYSATTHLLKMGFHIHVIFGHFCYTRLNRTKKIFSKISFIGNCRIKMFSLNLRIINDGNSIGCQCRIWVSTIYVDTWINKYSYNIIYYIKRFNTSIIVCNLSLFSWSNVIIYNYFIGNIMSYTLTRYSISIQQQIIHEMSIFN